MNICKGHVYIIFCHINPKIYYVGSTFNQLKYRWSEHKNTKTNNCSIKKYFDEYGIENFSIKLIKSYNVYRENSRDNKHLKVYEQLWINKFRNSCNIIHSFNPLKKLREKEYQKKYDQDNKKKIKQRKKEYYENNKKNILEKCKEWNENNKEKIKKYDKIRYENNKEQIKKKSKEYRENNKEQIKKKYTCECGSILTIAKKSRHSKSIKHQNFIKNNINNI